MHLWEIILIKAFSERSHKVVSTGLIGNHCFITYEKKNLKMSLTKGKYAGIRVMNNQGDDLEEI